MKTSWLYWKLVWTTWYTVESSRDLAIIKEALENTVSRLDFVSYDAAAFEGTLTRLPERSELNAEIDEALVVEYYNKLG